MSFDFIGDIRVHTRRAGPVPCEWCGEKIETGEYGECVNCGEAIGNKRLQARPVAELCIDCKSEQEKLERRTG